MSRRASSSLSDEQMKATIERLLQGVDASLVAVELGVALEDVRRLEKLRDKAFQTEARIRATEATREEKVLERLVVYLTALGFSEVEVKQGRQTGPDLRALKDGRCLAIEVKGDRPGHITNQGTIYVDVSTLLGQILMRKGEGAADEFAVAVRPIHMRLLQKALPVLRELSIGVILIEDEAICLMESTPSLLSKSS